MQRKASAVWQGDLKTGKGSISTDSGTLKQTQYSFSTRFENGVGTNPEELLAAAHAGCFTMALSAQLGNAGMTASKLETTATITLDKLPDGFQTAEFLLAHGVKVSGCTVHFVDEHLDHGAKALAASRRARGSSLSSRSMSTTGRGATRAETSSSVQTSSGTHRTVTSPSPGISPCSAVIAPRSPNPA